MDTAFRIPQLEVVAPSSGRPPIPTAGTPGTTSWRDSSGVLVGLGHIHREQPWLHIFGVASYHLVAHANKAVAVPFDSGTSEGISDEFERTVRYILLQLRGWELLHASAVLGQDGVILFCADSGSGKSTLAYGLSRAGHTIWSDDVVLLRITPGSATVASMPFRLRLKAPSLLHFETETGEDRTCHAQNSDSHGRRGRIGSLDSAPATAGAIERAAAICLLERVSSLPDGEPATVAEAGARGFPRLLQHAIFVSLEDPVRKKEMLTNFLDLAASVPILDLQIRDGLANLPHVIDFVAENVLARHPRGVVR